MMKEEMETQLSFDMGSNMWTAWTCIPKHINEFKERGWTVVSESESGTKFQAPSFAIHFKNAEKIKKKPMTEEQTIEMRKRMAKARDAKNVNKIINENDSKIDSGGI